MITLKESDKTIDGILVEKTDRLYRNFRDQVTIDELNKEIYFVKDGRIISENSKPSEEFVHDIETAQARYYLNNLSKEVRKGQNQKAKQSQYAGGSLPLGYFKNKNDKKIEIDTEVSSKIRHLFNLYAEGDCSITQLRKISKEMGLAYRKSGRPLSRSEIDRMLKKEFYTGKSRSETKITKFDTIELHIE